MPVASYSTTAGSNTAVGGIDITGTSGLVSQADDAMRAMMADQAALYDDLGGAGTVGGTADAITLTSTIAALATGLRVTFVAGADNTGAATLNVNSLGAKALRKIVGGTDVALAAGDIKDSGYYEAIYDAAANSAAGAWVVLNPSIPALTGITVNPASDAFDIRRASDDNLGPVAYLTHDSASPTADDVAGVHAVRGRNSVGALETYSQFHTIVTDPTDGSEDSRVDIYVKTAGADPRIASIGGTSFLVGTIVGINPASGTQDGSQMTTAGQFIASNTGNTAGAWRRQGSDGALHGFYRDTTNVGTITVTGSATAYNTSSDERLKENFADFDSGVIVDSITMLEFDFKAGGSGFGVKAQDDANALVPNFVSPGNGKEPEEEEFIGWSADYSKLVPILWREVQQLRARLAAAGL